MSDDLDRLLEDGVVDEVLGRLKSGKEADVWLVRHGEEILAAKMYKDRAQRSFKNNSAYKEGRDVRNSRTRRAIERGSRFGQAAAEDEWKAAESDALHKLHAAGVRVPAPVLFYEGVLLMQLARDAEGQPAPRLIDVALTADEAAAAYADLRQQAVKMLCCDLIHGDLSPYNVLMAAEGPTVIDFPQVVSAAHNSTAEAFFRRDVENLRQFFAAADPRLASRVGDAVEIWQTYVRRELSPDFVPSGRPPAPERRPQGGGRPQERSQRHGGFPNHHAPRGPAHGKQARPGPSHPSGEGRGARHFDAHAPQGRAAHEPRGSATQQHGRAPQQQGRGPQQHGRAPQQQGRGPQQQGRGPQQQHARGTQGPFGSGAPGRHPRKPQHPASGPQHPASGPQHPRAPQQRHASGPPQPRRGPQHHEARDPQHARGAQGHAHIPQPHGAAPHDAAPAEGPARAHPGSRSHPAPDQRGARRDGGRGRGHEGPAQRFGPIVERVMRPKPAGQHGDARSPAGDDERPRRGPKPVPPLSRE